MKKKKIIVTGGTGYIGSHTAVELISSGYDVMLADNLCNSSISTIYHIQEITGVKPCFEITTNAKVNYSSSPRRKGNFPQLYANPAKAYQKLGWKSELSLDDMTTSSWNWEKKLRNK